MRCRSGTGRTVSPLPPARTAAARPARGPPPASFGVYVAGAAQLAYQHSYVTAAGPTVMTMGTTLFRDAATLPVNIATGTVLLRMLRSATGAVQGQGGSGLARQLPGPADTVAAASAYDSSVNGHSRCRHYWPAGRCYWFYTPTNVSPPPASHIGGPCLADRAGNRHPARHRTATETILVTQYF